jgi:hypothetical protein
MPVSKPSQKAVTLTYDHGGWKLTIDDSLLTRNTDFMVNVINRPDPKHYRLIKTKKNNYQMV